MPSWSLKPVRIPGLPARIEIDPESGLGIGRSSDNGLVLDPEAFSQVSAHHVRLAIEDGNLVLSDLDSLNGTFANGERIESKVLRPGDIFQLGGGGPRFVIECSDDLSATRIQAVEPRDRTRSLGQSTVIRVKKALGLPPDADVGAMVKKTETRYRRIVVAAVVVVLGAAGTLYYFQDRSHQEVQRLEELSTKLAGELAETHAAIAAHRKSLDDHKSTLQQQRSDLQRRIQQIEADGRTSDAELGVLQRRLERTDRSLKLLDPVNLEHMKLEGVRRVREAVVFIETKVFLRDSRSKKRLHVDEESGGSRANLDDAGDVFASSNSGSGFVVSTDGMVITNAHVVEPDDYREPIHMRDGSVLIPEIEISVIFDGESKRHKAVLVDVAHEEDEDLALLKIEPFEGMSFLSDLNTDVPVPAPGAEVFLFGFPLGTMAIQPGDRVVGSTFKGILSRVVVTDLLQVDAAVHPGNSGGPVTDAAGRVIGIASAVQRMPEGHLTPAIGYVIPIASVARIWPRKSIVEASARKGPPK